MSRFAVVSRFLLLSAVAALLTHCSSEPAPVIEANDGSEMLLIPAGEFTMGGRKEDLEGFAGKGYLNYASENPLHKVSISRFYMDKYEITNSQYAKFLSDMGESGDKSNDHPDQPDNLHHRQQYINEKLNDPQQPAVGINWFDAYAYCNWAGKRLATEAEWEYAARGAGDVYRKYPWGNEDPDAEGIWRANYRPLPGADLDGFSHTAPVGSYPDGISPFGIMDMSGNAEEWVQDWLDVGYYAKTKGAQDPQGPLAGRNKVIKGGSYGSDLYHVRIGIRLYGAPHPKTELLGIRCAQSIE
ncbi:MAG: formylglycine-generating enzyme family protein [Candidatus Latescibacterota bacterium]